MEQKSNNIVDIRYQQTGQASAANELGMREMQAKASEARQKRLLLIKAPPASGKSRALIPQVRETSAPTADDRVTGYIYVLRSLSENPAISRQKDLYKIGFTTNRVEERIANAEHEPREWFVVPLNVVDIIIRRIMDGTIVGYTYRADLQCLQVVQ